ncbi:MAG: hypothetical protein QW063_01985 [Candidatus Nanoarchaeia archaeon]
MLKDIKRLIGKEGIERAKQEVDTLTKFETKIAVEIDKLDEPLRTIANFVQRKERLEHERNAMIKLLEMSANLQRELFDTNKRCAVILDHAKVHWPGRDSVRMELAKCKAKEDQIKFLLGYIEQAIARMHPISELAQKLIELEAEITKIGGDRMLMNIDEVLKKPSIQRGELVSIAKSLR